MAGKKDSVWVADKIVTELQGAMTAKLTALDREYADGITLATIPNHHYGLAEHVQPVGFPLLYVIPESADLNPAGGEVRYGIEYHTMTVAIAVVGNEDVDDLKRRSARSVRAVQEIMVSERTLSCSVSDVLPLSRAYSPLISSSDGLMQEAQIQLRVQTMT